MSTNFFEAIKHGDLEEVKRRLAQDPGLIHTKEDGLSPVIIAVYHQEPALADFLAEKTVNLTIFEAAATGKTHQVVRILARDHLLVNAWAEDGFQPLGLACFFGHLDTAKYLVKAGAAINNPSNNPPSATPLQSAAAAGHRKIALLLLDHGADPNVREQGGFTPLHAAAQNGDVDMIRALLFNGAILDARSDDGRTALDLAKEAGKTKAVDLLKEGITRRFPARRKGLT
jgi:ankyrin repeat protein